uniref:hypothetical protein n=1 Tax=Paractinoplanes polyasparticus TaxID=2856853 RepID=UPI001C8485B5|nr:hypothetical protein [Actinoplanes polyasparticus]
MKAWRSAIIATATLITRFAVTASGRQSEPAEQAMVLTNGDQSLYGGVRFNLKCQSVTGLYPDATRPIKIPLVDPFSFPLSLRSLESHLISIALAGTGRKAG